MNRLHSMMTVICTTPQDLTLSNNIVGSLIFYPEPHSADTLFIPANSFGANLFKLFMDQDADVTSSDLFLKFLKGFVLKSEFGNSVIGFKSDDRSDFSEDLLSYKW